jgi:glycosyltransferase involved in cell wall biosynthesis
MTDPRPVRVLVDLSVAPIGGAGTYALGFAAGLRDGDIADKDEIVVVVDAGWAEQHRDLVSGLREAGLVVDPIAFPPPGSWRARLGRRRVLRDAVVRHGVGVVYCPREVAPKLAVPVVIEVKNLYAWQRFESYGAVGGRASAMLLRWAAARSARRAARVLAVSQVIADTLPSDVAVHGVVHHGCDLPADDRSVPRAEDPEEMRLVMVGNAIANKRFEVAIDAAGLLVDRGRTVALDIYGGRSDEQYASALDERAQQVLGAPALRGTVDLDGLSAAYRRADVFIMGGTFESFCFPLVEAMRSGCVVVAPDAPLVHELCGDVAVTYVEGDASSLADALVRGWAERADRARRGVTRSLAFTWPDNAATAIGHVRAAAAP